MVSLLVGGALATGGLFERLWSYNRENFMWDVQNRQSRDFQVQNMAVSRYGLFREDIRDLAGLTTNKMDSYLIVNTLKLGFIVTLYYGFDRADTPLERIPLRDRLVTLLFSVCFLTSFFFFLTSIWFSMHAIVVAQSFMTKMLVQTVRIPMPTNQDISSVTPEASEFEGRFDMAFRLPGTARKSGQGTLTTGPNRRASRSPPPVTPRLGLTRRSSTLSGRSALSEASSSRMGTDPGAVELPSPTPTVDPMAWERLSENSATGRVSFGVVSVGSAAGGVADASCEQSVSDSASACGDAPGSGNIGLIRRFSDAARRRSNSVGIVNNECAGGLVRAAVSAATTVGALHGSHAVAAATAAAAAAQTSRQCAEEVRQPEGSDVYAVIERIQPKSLPHLKLYRQLMLNWQPYDLYSKISMSIGTSTMLSGLAYHSVFYGRVQSSGTDTEELLGFSVGVWYAFSFMSVLAWWSVTLDLILGRLQHFMLAIMALGGPAIFATGFISKGAWQFCIPIAFVLQGTWVWLLLATTHGDPPWRWRASLFLDVLSDSRPRIGSEAAETNASEDASGASFRVQNATTRSATRSMLRYLDLLLEEQQRSEPLLTQHEEAEVRRERRRLRAAAAAAGVLPPVLSADDGAVTFGPEDVIPDPPSEGLWLLVPASGADTRPRLRWLSSRDPSGDTSPDRGGADREADLSKESSQVATLGEVLEAARRSVDVLHRQAADATEWTDLDRDRLHVYGGVTCSSVRSFEAPFRSRGASATQDLGAAAKRYFRMGAVFVGSAWTVAVLECHFHCIAYATTHGSWDGGGGNLRFGTLLLDRWTFSTLAVEAPERGHVGTPALTRAGSLEPLVLPRPWLLPSTAACDAAGGRWAIADGVRAYVHAEPDARPATSGSLNWLGPLSACDGSDAVAVAFSATAEAIVVGASGALGPGKPAGSNISCIWRPLSGQPVELLALHSELAPAGSAGARVAGGAPPQRVRGLAARRGELLALEEESVGSGWQVAGRLPAPPGGQHRWAALALRSGRASALNASGHLFEMDTDMGTWSGPWRLDPVGHGAWRGLCALPGGGSWLALKSPGGGAAGGELLRFDRPWPAPTS